ncbi:MAG: PKD domain-containing protein [Sphingobacteriales bacterium]|nr:MAG: PKD domain-containing protein [Sphingobacteriales bacterium]
MPRNNKMCGILNIRRMRFLTFTIFFIFFVLSTLAQPYFSKQYSWVNVQQAKKIIQNDSLYILGSDFVNMSTNLWVSCNLKVDMDGNNWNRTDYVGTYIESNARDILKYGGNNFFFVNSAKNLNTGEGFSWFLFLNENLGVENTISSEALANQTYCASLTNDNQILTGGWILKPSQSGFHLYLTKLDPISGDVLMDTTYSNLYTPFTLSWIQDITATPDGGAYLLATINNGGFDGDISLIKIDSLGNWQWHQIYDIGAGLWDSQDFAGYIKITQDGGVVFTGHKSPYIQYYGEIFKLNADLTVQWHSEEHFYNGAPCGIIELADSCMVVGGFGVLPQTSGSMRGEIVKLDKGGNTLWKRTYGGNKNDYFYDAIVQNHDYSGKSGYVLCGRTESNLPPGRADAWLVRLNCMGLLTKPEALFSHTVLAGSPPNVITFINQSQYVYPDSIDGGFYRWSWGDGTPPFVCGQGYEPCGGSLPSHTYQTPGIYGVTLTAIVCNDTATYTQYVCAGNYSPGAQASFVAEDFGGTVFFANTSQNAHFDQTGISIWDFGDGSFPSYETHPHHTYAENGSYTVTLTVVVCADTSVYTQEVVVQTVGISEIPSSEGFGVGSLQVYPNPAQNTLTFERVSKSPLGDLGVTVDLGVSFYNLTGQTVLQTTLAAGETHKTVSVAHLPEGLYVYVVEDGGAVLAG